MRKNIPLTHQKWFLPTVYILLFLISALPTITEVPYSPRDSQQVIVQILSVSLLPYRDWGWIFHTATLLLIPILLAFPGAGGRVVSAYFGVNYLVIAALQTHAETADFGYAVQTGSLVLCVILGVMWIAIALFRNPRASFKDIPPWRWLLLPFAVLVFWSPVRMVETGVVPDFDPHLLLTSVDYGLAFCFITPVFLFFLILFHPGINQTALRITAFSGLLFGLYNLPNWFQPETRWMGVMHVPLLVIPLAALLLPGKPADQETAAGSGNTFSP